MTVYIAHLMCEHGHRILGGAGLFRDPKHAASVLPFALGDIWQKNGSKPCGTCGCDQLVVGIAETEFSTLEEAKEVLDSMESTEFASALGRHVRN